MMLGNIGTIDFTNEEEKKLLLKLLYKIPALEGKDTNIIVLESLTRALMKKYNYRVPLVYFSLKTYTCSVEKDDKTISTIYALNIEEFYIKLVCLLYWHNKNMRYFR